MGLREQSGRSLFDALLEHLEHKRLLLVLDNCEHVLWRADELVGAVLLRCPAVQVLATSREPLRVQDQAVYEVPPMALPADPATAPVAQALHFDAVRLFAIRAMAARPAFRLDDANAVQVTRICARLEGIPLAIELAARLRDLTLPQLEARIEDRLQLLRGGRHARRPGHVSLEAALDVSYDLLTELEQAILRRLAVFRGGWMLETAEAVCSDEVMDEAEIRGLLARLQSKSLIEMRSSESSSRYGMLETVRQYAAERLRDAGDDAKQRRRHADFFMDVAERSEVALKGGEQAAWLARLDADRENVLAAIDWATEAGEVELGLRTASALWRFWFLRGLFSGEIRDQ